MLQLCSMSFRNTSNTKEAMEKVITQQQQQQQQQHEEVGGGGGKSHLDRQLHLAKLKRRPLRVWEATTQTERDVPL